MGRLFVRNGSRVAAAAVLSLAMSGVMALAQDNSGAPPPPPPPAQDQQGPMGHGGPHGREGSERQLEMMTKRLNLTPDQVSQVKAIEADTMTQAQGLRADTTVSQADRKSKMMSIHEAAQTKIRAVLNDEQKTKFDAMEAHRKERMHHGEGEAPPPPPPA